MAHIVWLETMKEKTAQFYSETQTEQKNAIWCRCWYLWYNYDAFNVNQWDVSNSRDSHITLYLH